LRALASKASTESDFAALNALLDALGDGASLSVTWQKVRASVDASAYEALRELHAREGAPESDGETAADSVDAEQLQWGRGFNTAETDR